MTVRTRHFGRVLIGLVVVCFVAGGLSVEAITHAGVSRAERGLPVALARAVVPETAGEAAATQLAAARRHAARQQPGRAAAELERLAEESPSHEIHTAAAYAWMAADRGIAAARHAELAMRLAPDDPRAVALAERAVDVAVAYKVRPFSRPLGAFGALMLLVSMAALFRHRRERKQRARFLASISARVHMWADGEQLRHPFRIRPGTERLTLDVFLSGRYGMATPRRPANAPSLHLAFSSPGSNQTIRMRPVKEITDNAIRVPVSDETLKRLLERPGGWRLHVRLGERPILAVPITVGDAEAPRAHAHRAYDESDRCGRAKKRCGVRGFWRARV